MTNCMSLKVIAVALGFIGAMPLLARAANTDEEKVGKYTLPDPLRLDTGETVDNQKVWFDRRRPEIERLFEDNMYGRSPGRPAEMTFDVFDNDSKALDGRAIRKQVTINFFGQKDGPKMNVLMYLPTDAPKPVPLFLCLSFGGNHRLTKDPAVKITETWDRRTKARQLEDDSTRGTAKGFEVDKTLARGYGIAVMYYCDIEPDFLGGLPYGVRAHYLKPGQSEPGPDEWGAIGAWAWGASRAMDYLETDKDVDARRVIMLGQSRLGKTALWAGAHDDRFAMVIAANSGEGGASLMRRDFGETVKDLCTKFPYQFCANFQKYADHVDQLPIDSHELLALIAPRPFYLSAGSEDLQADPKGEFLAAVAAGPVYELLGEKGLGADQMPPLDTPIMRRIGFHCHTGKHEITPFDWDCYFKFADMHLKKQL
jgi:hypothetical protein